MKHKMPKEKVDRNRWVAKQKLRELQELIERSKRNGGV